LTAAVERVGSGADVPAVIAAAALAVAFARSHHDRRPAGTGTFRSPQPGRFAGLKLGKPVAPEPKVREDTLGKAVERYAKAIGEVARMRSGACRRSRCTRPKGPKRARCSKRCSRRRAGISMPPLRGNRAGQRGGQWRTNNAIRQLQLEAELRVNPNCAPSAPLTGRRAPGSSRRSRARRREAAGVREDAKDMARQLARDPQLESLLRVRSG
jgi:hypothetical protein